MLIPSYRSDANEFDSVDNFMNLTRDPRATGRSLARIRILGRSQERPRTNLGMRRDGNVRGFDIQAGEPAIRWTPGRHRGLRNGSLSLLEDESRILSTGNPINANEDITAASPTDPSFPVFFSPARVATSPSP